MWIKLTEGNAAWRRSAPRSPFPAFGGRRAADPGVAVNGAGAAPAAVLEPDDARTATAPRALVADADIELSDEILLLRRRLGAMARDLETSEAEVRLLRRELAARPTDGAVVPRGGASQPARDEKRRSLLAKIVEQNVALRNATS